MIFEISELEGGVKLAKLSGKLDLQGTNEIDNRFAFATATSKLPVIVDLSEVDFLASIGMRMLVSNARAIKMRGAQMVLLNPTPLVKEALVTAGIDQIIPIHEDFDQIYEALKAPSNPTES
jgi:anti-sigma B factor antagonist